MLYTQKAVEPLALKRAIVDALGATEVAPSPSLRIAALASHSARTRTPSQPESFGICARARSGEACNRNAKGRRATNRAADNISVTWWNEIWHRQTLVEAVPLAHQARENVATVTAHLFHGGTRYNHCSQPSMTKAGSS